MPSIRRVAFSSALEISVSRPRRRVRTLDLFSRRWERKALRRRSRPVPVTLIRLAAPRSVFIFGMASSLFGRRRDFADCTIFLNRSTAVGLGGGGVRGRRGGLLGALLVRSPRLRGLA